MSSKKEKEELPLKRTLEPWLEAARVKPLTEFCRLVEEAVGDEAEAKEFYADVERAVKKEVEDRTVQRRLTNIIREVAKDEEGHRESFQKLKREFCEGRKRGRR